MSDTNLVYERVVALLARVTYKPDSQFIIDRVDPQGCTVRLSSRVPDADTGKPTEFWSQTSLICGDNDDAWIMKDVLEMICRWERHEAMEWLKLDGKTFFNPHDQRVPG